MLSILYSLYKGISRIFRLSGHRLKYQCSGATLRSRRLGGITDYKKMEFIVHFFSSTLRMNFLNFTFFRYQKMSDKTIDVAQIT